MPQVIDYAKKYASEVDERFKEGAKSNGVVNQNFDWIGAKTVEVYSVSTATMNDYARTGTGNRFGAIEDLNAETQELVLSKDRSFVFAIDKLQGDETANALEAGKALARQIREKIIPEVDTHRFTVMAAKAGNNATLALTADNIYDEILDGVAALDDAEVPVVGRQIVVNSATYKLMKANAAKTSGMTLETEGITTEQREKGVVAILDDMEVIKVPSSRLVVANFGFMLAHPLATTGPVKLAEYRIHKDPPGVSGSLVEGRVAYDAFVLDSKVDAIYLHVIA